MELKSLYIYLAEDCNLKCAHCWVESGPNVSRNRLSFCEAEDFLKRAISLGLKSVILSGGEPFLNKDIFKFLEFFHNNEIHVNIETNGTLINSSNIDLIRKYGPYLAISIDGITQEIHEKQRGKNSYKKVLEAIHLVNSLELPFQLIMAVSRSNDKEVEKVIEYINKNGLIYCDKLKLNPISLTGRAHDMASNNELYSYEELFDLGERIQKLNKENKTTVILHLNKPFLQFDQIMEGIGCGGYCGIRSSMSILPDGRVSVCSLGRFVDNKFVFGKCNAIDLNKLWNENSLLLDLRSDDYPQKLEGVCSKCIFKKGCRGSCRAHSLVDYGNIYSAYPKCQELYDAGLFPSKYLITNEIR